MAVVARKSFTITNRDAVPRVLTDSRISKAHLEEFAGAVQVQSGDSIGSTLIFGQLASNTRMSQILLNSDAVTGAAMDIGLYRTTDDGSGVANPFNGTTQTLSKQLFAIAQSVATAVKNLDVTNQSGNFTPILQDRQLWEVLGLAADPSCFYDVVGTLTAAASAAGYVQMKARYTL